MDKRRVRVSSPVPHFLKLRLREQIFCEQFHMRRFLPQSKALVLASALFVSGCIEKDSASESDSEETESYQAEKSERDEIRKRLSDLRAQKKELESELKDLTKAASEKPEVMAKELEIATQLEAARGYVSKLTSLEGELDAVLQVWRPSTRNSFKGVTLPEVVTTDGNRFTTVTIKEVTDENLTILHSGGEATVPILQLPVGLRRNLIHESTVLAEQFSPTN